MLHATLKALNRDLDFSDILKPLLAETGPAVTHVPKLYKQITRMRKYLKELLCVKAQHKPLAVQAAQQLLQQCRPIFCINYLHKHFLIFSALHKHLAVQRQQHLRLQQFIGRNLPTAAGGGHLHLPDTLFQRKCYQLWGR